MNAKKPNAGQGGQAPKQSSFSDQDILNDMLASQKFITGGYNTFTNECATPALRTEFMNSLSDEHKIQADVFTEMQARGFYPTETADAAKVNEAKQKFASQ
jgi:spore coat protein CotF